MLDTVDRYILRYQNNAAGIKIGQSQGATLLSARSKQARNMFQSPEICKSKGMDQCTSCRGASSSHQLEVRRICFVTALRKIHLCPQRVACKHSLSKGAGFDAWDQEVPTKYSGAHLRPNSLDHLQLIVHSETYPRGGGNTDKHWLAAAQLDILPVDKRDSIASPYIQEQKNKTKKLLLLFAHMCNNEW